MMKKSRFFVPVAGTLFIASLSFFSPLDQHGKTTDAGTNQLTPTPSKTQILGGMVVKTKLIFPKRPDGHIVADEVNQLLAHYEHRHVPNEG